MERDLGQARKAFDRLERLVDAQGRIIKDHTLTFQAMQATMKDQAASMKTYQETINFHAVFVGEQGEDLGRLQTAFEKSQDEVKNSSRHQQGLMRSLNERITRRRLEIDDQAVLVGDLGGCLNVLLTICLIDQGDGRSYR